jgi:hypothetical protein
MTQVHIDTKNLFETINIIIKKNRPLNLLNNGLNLHCYFYMNYLLIIPSPLVVFITILFLEFLIFPSKSFLFPFNDVS